jgi:hypothetical protein
MTKTPRTALCACLLSPLLATTVSAAKDEYVTVDFDNRASEALVFPHEQLLASTEAILSDNGVRAQGSPDMMLIWERK